MRHNAVNVRLCHWYAVLLLLPAGPLQAQTAVGIGVTRQYVTGALSPEHLSGVQFDLTIRTSRVSDLIVRGQFIGHDGSPDRSANRVRSLEVGLQALAGRGHLVQLGLGFGLGAFLHVEYDASTYGFSGFARARLAAYPSPPLGLYLEGGFQAHLADYGKSAMGLAVGLTFSTTH